MNSGGGRTADDRQHTTFETELAAAVAGRPLRMHVGLGPDTDAALITIALAHPDVTHDMIEAARRAFVAESVAGDSGAADVPAEPVLSPEASP
ncbi:hypothetical protein ACRS5S_22220 [Nocardia asiatica]|uniref:hypothetical protein n=1 Tax=Nocardia asiatica TaxID=209252 RepID=UPI0024567545|nr:hypothetical protein [Nocardia asiatica]